MMDSFEGSSERASAGIPAELSLARRVTTRSTLGSGSGMRGAAVKASASTGTAMRTSGDGWATRDMARGK